MAESLFKDGERLHALDAVRGGALMLGVAFHGTMTFLLGPQIWVVRDTQSTGLTAFFIVSHMFRMTLFFVIAGFFRAAADRETRPARLRPEPAVADHLADDPVLAAGDRRHPHSLVWGAFVMNGGQAPANPPPAALALGATFPLTHLWFLYVLTILYGGAILLRLVPGAQTIMQAVDAVVRRAMEWRVAALLLAIPGFFMLAGKADWIVSAGVPTPDTG